MVTRIAHYPSAHDQTYRDGAEKIMTVGCFSYGEAFYLHAERTESILRIGRYCSIAQNVQFFLGHEHNLDWGTTYPFPALPADWTELRTLQGHPLSRGDITVGNDVWIGYGALVRSGVSIGDGAVVGMGAVVTRDVPPYAIAAGNPARVLRYRFAVEVIEELRQIAWWGLPHGIVRKIAPLLCRRLDKAGLAALKAELARLAHG